TTFQDVFVLTRVLLSNCFEFLTEKLLEAVDRYAPHFMAKPIYITYGLLTEQVKIYWHWNSWHKPFSILLYDDFLTQKQLDLDILRNSVEPENFIEQALNMASDCSFVIFSASDGEYIQFWVKNNTLIHSFPLHPNTNMP